MSKLSKSRFKKDFGTESREHKDVERRPFMTDCGGFTPMTVESHQPYRDERRLVKSKNASLKFGIAKSALALQDLCLPEVKQINKNSFLPPCGQIKYNPSDCTLPGSSCELHEEYF
jgi:hypothetical protein